jgi:hypothetical protein
MGAIFRGCIAERMLEMKKAVDSRNVSASGSNELLCDGSPEKFEDELFKLINKHIKCGLRKPDLLKKMKWATGNCEFS